MHTLELIAWFNNCLSRCADGVSRANSNVSSNSNTDLSASALTKNQAYALLSALQQVLGSYGAEQLLSQAHASSSTAGSDDKSDEQVDKLQSLKLSLLGILCSSTISENAQRAKSTHGATDNYQHTAAQAASSKTLLMGMQSSRGAGRFSSWSGRTSVGPTSIASLSRFEYGGERKDSRGPILSGGKNLQHALAYEMLTGSNIVGL